MKLEEGKYYVTRSGERVRASYDEGVIMRLSNGKHVYTATGRGNGACSADTETDIISEWQDTPPTQGPIREVRRREIVPGVYGAFYVSGLDRVEMNKVGFQFFEKNDSEPLNMLSSQKLREAAHLFNRLAEFLEEEG